MLSFNLHFVHRKCNDFFSKASFVVGQSSTHLNTDLFLWRCIFLMASLDSSQGMSLTTLGVSKLQHRGAKPSHCLFLYSLQAENDFYIFK